jgi:hypothetical protein
MFRRFHFCMDVNDGGQGSGGGAGGGTGAGGASENAGGAGGGGAAFAIPETYKTKEYLKDAKSYDDVFKMLDGAQTLIGKRPAGIPDDKASPEDWDRFYATAGRPEKAELYEFDDAALPEGQKRDPEFAGKIKGIMHKAGLSTRQAKQLQTEYDKLIGEGMAAQTKSAQEADAKFETDAQALFGARKDEALGIAKNLLGAHLPESMKGHIEKLGNQELLMLASVLDSVNAKYIKEDGPNKGGGGGSAKSAVEIEKEATDLMATDAYRSNMHKDHDSTRQKVRELFVQANRLKSAQ